MIPADVLEEVSEETLRLWYGPAGLRIEYLRELADIEHPRAPESCGWVNLSGGVAS